MPGFQLPAVEDNTEGWGPTSVPAQFVDVPFMPFGKGERLGRIAEFGATAGRTHYQGALYSKLHHCEIKFIILLLR